MIVLVDTGILVRYFQPHDAAYPPIHSTLARLQTGGDQITTSLQNLSEFWNVCTRPKPARGGLGLSIAETDRRLTVLEQGLPILDEHPDTYPIWRGLVVRHAVSGRQVHDTRLAALMLAHGITHILTLNGSDFTRFPGITVIDPQTP